MQVSETMAKVLQISNYPPPMCGWAMQTKMLVDELRSRGDTCQVLNINESRKIKGAEYVDVQNGLDYLLKLLRFGFSGYKFHMHVNAESKKGYFLGLAAVLVGRLTRRPSLLTFHGGLPQTYFPRADSLKHRLAFKSLFHLSGTITCNNEQLRSAIAAYGIPVSKIEAIPTFSPEVMKFQRQPIDPAVEEFLRSHSPVFFSYVCYRPEFRLEVYRQAMRRIRQEHPSAGFLWLGFTQKELPIALEYIGSWDADEQASVFTLGNLDHDRFLSLLERCFAYIRTPACDGVSTSVLESLSIGVPVIASENRRRPEGVVTYEESDAEDLAVKTLYVIANHDAVKAQTRIESGPGSGPGTNNTARTVDFLLGVNPRAAASEISLAK